MIRLWHVPPPTAESGVGAGIDSYYEYCLKSYILLGDEEYLRRFSAVSGACALTHTLIIVT